MAARTSAGVMRVPAGRCRDEEEDPGYVSQQGSPNQSRAFAAGEPGDEAAVVLRREHRPRAARPLSVDAEAAVLRAAVGMSALPALDAVMELKSRSDGRPVSEPGTRSKRAVREEIATELRRAEGREQWLQKRLSLLSSGCAASL